MAFPVGQQIAGYAQPGISSNALHLFAVANDGYTREYVYTTSSHTWSVNSTITVCNFTQGASAIVPLTLYESRGYVDIFGVLSNGDLGQEQRSGSGSWGGGDNAPLGPQFPAHTPLVLEQINGTIDVFGVDASQAIRHIQYNGAWGVKETISEAANHLVVGAPLSIYESSSGVYEIFAINSLGQVVQAQYIPGSGWGGGPNPYSSGFVANSQPAFYFDTSTGYMEIYGLGNDGAIQNLEYSGPWRQHDLGKSLSPSADVFILGERTSLDNNGNLSQQNIFSVGSDGLVRENAYQPNNHAATGQVVIDPVTKFSSTANLTSFSDGVSENVFAVGTNGVLDWAQQLNGRQWTPFTAIGPSVFPPPWTFTSGETIVGYSYAGSLHLFGVGSDGYVHEYVYSTSTNTWAIQPAVTICHFEAGTPLAISESGGSVNLFGVLPDGDIGQDARNNGGSWHGGDNMPLGSQFLPGTPLAFEALNGTLDLFGVNAQGNITHVQYGAGGWVVKETISEAGNYLEAASPLTIYEGPTGLFELFAINSNGQVVQAQFTPGSGRLRHNR